MSSYLERLSSPVIVTFELSMSRLLEKTVNCFRSLVARTRHIDGHTAAAGLSTVGAMANV